MITNTGMFTFKKFLDKWGELVPIEEKIDVPFSIKRIYYISKVQGGVRRGFHSHRDLHQALICVHGTVKILVKTPYEEEDILLDDQTKGLYIGPMVWREMYDFSPDAVLLVLASEHYTESDYIRDYEQYEAEAKEYFSALKV
ncbi:FdtA/QdtA family cupin domain-containing protein [uncultured Clostridium sp.]|uniref:sugar 3,4-ketoisomerase n=1 Tax=uncultured Clostridium sp. TaxID=59620 RepID=UPI0025D47C92|nr:FdtA/QdtA family cupin domain-containing protein [uncultured Clostridium sp.]